MPRSYTVEADGQVIPFTAPDDATALQLRTLAARALKQAQPGKQYQKPVLEDRIRKQFAQSQAIDPMADSPMKGTISAVKPTLESRISGGLKGVLSNFLEEHHAQRLADKATSFLNDVTPVGGGIEADKAKDAFAQGDYAGAAGHGALAAFNLIPEAGGAIAHAAAPVAHAMFLGALSKTADKEALARARQMYESYAHDRNEIWRETGWFKGADEKWRYEVPDNEMAFQPNVTDTLEASAMRGKRSPLSEVISHPALTDAYPQASDIGVSKYNMGPGALMGSFSNGEAGPLLDINEKLFEPPPGFTSPSLGLARSTAAHELQHFVQGQEGFARGGMTGTIPAQEVNPEVATIQNRIDELETEIGKWPNGHRPWALDNEQKRLRERLREIQPAAEYEGYRRLAGEVEARNVQTRLNMTPEERIANPPWTTEDVPRDQQFVLWHGSPGAEGDGVSAAIEPLWHGSPHAFDRFDLGKIGTGEGAQAYGHGLYFAENKDVAQEYQRTLSPSFYRWHDGSLTHILPGTGQDYAAQAWNRAAGDPAKARQEFDALIAERNRLSSGLSEPQRRQAETALERLQGGVWKPEQSGHLYQVKLDANPEDFLDYDAPVADQPLAMEVLRNLDLDKTGALSRTKTMLGFARDGRELPEYRTKGRELLNAVSNYGENRAAEHGALMPFGIKGVRYLDQGSRAAADGTRNYVVYDPSLIDIINRY